MIQMNLCTKKKKTHRHEKQKYGYQRGRGGMDKLGVCGQHIYTTIYKIDNQKGSTVSTGNYTQYFVITYKGKESENECVYIYIMYSNHCIVHLKLTGCYKSTICVLKKQEFLSWYSGNESD